MEQRLVRPVTRMKEDAAAIAGSVVAVIHVAHHEVMQASRQVSVSDIAGGDLVRETVQLPGAIGSLPGLHVLDSAASGDVEASNLPGERVEILYGLQAVAAYGGGPGLALGEIHRGF